MYYHIEKHNMIDCQTHNDIYGGIYQKINIQNYKKNYLFVHYHCMNFMILAGSECHNFLRNISVKKRITNNISQNNKKDWDVPAND